MAARNCFGQEGNGPNDRITTFLKALQEQLEQKATCVVLLECISTHNDICCIPANATIDSKNLTRI